MALRVTKKDVLRFSTCYCRHCWQRIEFPEDRAGDFTECPSCQKEIILGETTSTPEPEPSPVVEAEPEPPRIEPEPPRQADNRLRCLRCGSPDLSANKKGFGLGKAAGGLVLLGPVGLLGGLIGSGRIQVTCLRCGFTFEPGNR